MVKRALFAVFGFVALCLPIAAQQTNGTDALDPAATLALYRPEIFTTVDSSVLVRDLPMLTFLDGRLPGSTALGRMGIAPVANFPLALVGAAPARKANSAPASGKDGKDSPAEVMTLQPSPEIYSGGEIGAFYGRSSGKFGREDFGSYIIGVVGDDKFQITVGASYEESNGRVPRWAR